MNQLERINEIIETYVRHGWRLERLLLTPQTGADGAAVLASDASFQENMVHEFTVDALWFKRASGQDGREAWELRLVADAPYALFETFEADEADEDREEVRREMEARMAEHTAPRIIE